MSQDVRKRRMWDLTYRERSKTAGTATSSVSCPFYKKCRLTRKALRISQGRKGNCHAAAISASR